MPLVLLLLLALLPLPSLAQSGLVLFPASQYGRNYLTLPQSAAGLSTTQLQNVLGRNANFERLDSYRADDRFRKMASPVGRLDLLIEGAGGTGVGNCTASIISARFILTNRHCFPERDRVVRASLLMDFYSEDNDRDSRRFEIATAPSEVNAELDYAIVEVRGNPSAAFGTVRLDPRDPQPGESLLIIHHPMGLPKHMTRGGCRAYQPNAVDGTDIRHRCDTLPGSSGSPILAEATGRMVGLHYGGTTNPSAASWNSGKRLAEIARRSRILASVVAEQRLQEEGAARDAASNSAAERAEIERRAREQAEAAARAEIERRTRDADAARAEIERLRAQLDAERARISALPPPSVAAVTVSPATPRPVPADDPAAAELALGLTANQVRTMQRWLDVLGHDPRGVDGRIGAGTRAALRSYQRAKGLTETGYLDAGVVTMLQAEGARMEMLHSGDIVRYLQDLADEGVAAAAKGRPRPLAPSSPAQPTSGIPSTLPPEAQYEFALGLLREAQRGQSDFGSAEAAMKAFVAQNPNHRRASDAQYWYGETLYARRDWNNAVIAFTEGFKKYPNSDKAPDNLLRLGMSLGHLNRRGDACGVLAEIGRRHPDAPLVLRQHVVRERRNLGC